MSIVNDGSRKTALHTRMIAALSAFALLAIGACGGDDADPGETVRAYIDAYNAQDIDAVMVVFAADAVITNHPFASRIEGAEAIRTLQIDDIGAAGRDNAYEISDLEVSGDTVTWNHVWNDRCTGTGNEALVENGEIVSWVFASVSC